MKNIRNNIGQWLESLDQRWDKMPIKKQHSYIQYFFAAYLLLTAVIIFNVWQETKGAGKHMVIRHIENPVPARKEVPAALQDSLKSILKNKIYEKR